MLHGKTKTSTEGGLLFIFNMDKLGPTQRSGVNPGLPKERYEAKQKLSAQLDFITFSREKVVVMYRALLVIPSSWNKPSAFFPPSYSFNA
jgi:hypothetical protein